MTTRQRINALQQEAAQHGDTDQVERCETASAYDLYDYDTNEELELDDLDCDVVEWVDAVCDSVAEVFDNQGTGAVRLAGRTVYAQE